MKEIKSNNELSSFQFIKTDELLGLDVYNKFVNWIAGEFDLYLMQEEQGLKVYFPDGWFTISNSNNDSILILEIQVEAKSKMTYEKIVKKIQDVYNRVSYSFEHRVDY